MADYELIKEMVKRKGLSLQEVATQLGYEYTGFYQAIKRDSLRLEKRHMLAEILGVPINKLWEGTEAVIDNKKDDSIQALRATLDLYKKQIEIQEELIEMLKKEIKRKD